MSKFFPLAIVLCFTFSFLAPIANHFQSELEDEKLASHSSNQDFEWLWGDIISGGNYEFANAIATDSNGNLFVGGSFNGGYIEQNGTLHYNAGTYGQFDSYTNDMFLAKYNSSGNLEWFQTYGESNSTETINGVAIAADGDIVICGSAKGNFSLGSHTVNYTYIDGLYDGVARLAGHWLAELNSTGQVNWVKPMENADICESGEQIGGSLSVLKISPNTGSIYTVGHSKMKTNIWGCQCNNSSFGGIIVENTNDDWEENGFVVKFDANGTFQWRYEIPGKNGSFKDLDLFWDGSHETIYSSGFLEYPGNGVDFPGTSITLACNDCQKARDPFIATIDASNGQVNWATKASPVKSTASSYTYQSMNRISIDGSGNAILVGGFSGQTMIFSDLSGSQIQINNSGENDGYIAKINNMGYWQWAKQLGDLPSRSEWISDVDVDVNGNAIVSGGFRGESVDIGNTTLTNSYSNNYDADLFIAAIDADGEWLWANSTQGTTYDNGDLVMFSGNTSAYVIGQTFGGLSWGNNTDTSTYGGANQIFVGKFEFPKMIFDSDLDGVNDEADDCLETEVNSIVDQDGCPAEFELIIDEVSDEFGGFLGGSIAVNSVDDVYISAPYYNGNLVLKQLNTSAAGIEWDNDVIIDSSSRNYAQDTSLYFDFNDTPHVAFHYTDNRDMEYAVKNQSVWELAVVDTEGSNGIANVGQQHDIVVDSFGIPHVVYNELGIGGNSVYASIKNGVWVEDFVFMGAPAFGKNSFGIDSNDNLHLILTHSNGSIMYATNEDGYWDVNMTLGVQGNTVYGPDDSEVTLIVDEQDNVHVSYCLMGNTTNGLPYDAGSLMYSSKKNGLWTNDLVDSGIDCSYHNGERAHSITVDSYGFVHILYMKSDSGLGYPDHLAYSSNSKSTWDTYHLFSLEDSIDDQTSLTIDSENNLHGIFEWRPGGSGGAVTTSYLQINIDWTHLDNDSDGVPDDDDLCPNTASGVSVNQDGCSVAQLDEDGDGVGDYIDQCPNTPTGESVDFFGCSQSQLDDDGDGVMNDIDQCPNTLAGESVDAVGCSQSQLDDDGDGVMNDIDQCLNTPVGESVDAVGCSQSQLDDDGDGVMNDIDQCPNTLAGESVDAVGCSQSQLDDDGDGVMNNIDQCPNTPIGVNVGPNGCNSPPICTFYYDDSSGSQTIFIQDLPMGSGSQVASLSLVSGTYQFHVECNDPESDSIQMTVTFDGGPDNMFTGSPLVSGPLPVTLNDGVNLSKELTYVWTDGTNSGTFDVIFSIEGDDNTGSGGSFIPGFELQLVIFAIIFAFAMPRKRI